MMTVNQLIDLLKQCPQDAPIALYYDGAPRLNPDGAYWGEIVMYIDGEEVDTIGVALGQTSDIYSPKNPKWFFKNGKVVKP